MEIFDLYIFISTYGSAIVHPGVQKDFYKYKRKYGKEGYKYEKCNDQASQNRRISNISR